jgi:signal transduction histidine kinase
VSRKGPSKGRTVRRKPEASAPNTSDLSLHLIQAQEEERKRISRELHDEAGQGLMVLRLYLGMLVSDSTNPELASKIQEAMNMLDRTIGDLRRIIARLSPRILDEMGLMPAIRKEARELSRTTGMKAQLELPESLETDHRIEVAVYRSVQEALNNVAKHSQARNFRVCVEREDGAVRVLVEDDGVGITRNGGSRSRTFGLLGMRERIAALGGTVRVQSRKGRGTKVRVTLPIPCRRKRTLKGGEKNEPGRMPSKAEPKPSTRTVAALSGLAKATYQYPNVH